MFRKIPGPFGQFASVVGNMGNSARQNMGDAQYNQTKSGASWGLAIGSGFLPITPFLVPFQIVIIIVLTTIIFATTSAGFKYSVLYGYLLQAVLVAITYHEFLNIYISSGFGL